MAAPVAIVAAAPPVVRGTAGVILDGSASTSAATYAWSQVSGPAVALTGQTTAKPTFTVPYLTTTSAQAPAPAADPLRFRLVVTSAGGVASDPAVVEVPVKADTLTVGTTRHKVGTELRVDGTSLIDGVAGVRTPPTSVVIWNMANPAAPVKLGSSPVDTLGAWVLRLKPGPGTQVTTVLIQSTRGGTSTATLTR